MRQRIDGNLEELLRAFLSIVYIYLLTAELDVDWRQSTTSLTSKSAWRGIGMEFLGVSSAQCSRYSGVIWLID